MKKFTSIAFLLTLMGTFGVMAQGWEKVWSQDYTDPATYKDGWTVNTGTVSQYSYGADKLFLILVSKGSDPSATFTLPQTVETSYRLTFMGTVGPTSKTPNPTIVFTGQDCDTLFHTRSEGGNGKPSVTHVYKRDGTEVGSLSTDLRNPGESTVYQYFCQFAIEGSVEKNNVMLHVTNEDGSVEYVDSVVIADQFIPVTGMVVHFKSGGYNTSLLLGNMMLSKWTNQAVATDPVISLTGVQGAGRQYEIAYKAGETLHYQLPGQAEYREESEVNPISVLADQSGQLSAYTTIGEAVSDTIVVNVDATEVELAPVSVSKEAYNETDSTWSLRLSTNQHDVLLQPLAQIAFVNEAGTQVVLSANQVVDSLACGRYTYYAFAEGYKNSKVDTIELLPRKKMWTNWEEDFIANNPKTNTAALELSSTGAFKADGATYYPVVFYREKTYVIPADPEHGILRDSTVYEPDTIIGNSHFGLTTTTNWLYQSRYTSLYCNSNSKNFALKGLKPGQRVYISASYGLESFDSFGDLLELKPEECTATELVFEVLAKGNGVVTMTGRSYNYLFKVRVSRENETEEVSDPLLNITNVDGLSRTVAMTQDEDEEIWYSANGAAYTLYEEPVVINESTIFKAYAKSDIGTLSDTVTFTAPAGVPVVLAGVTAEKVAFVDSLSAYTLRLSTSQADILCKPMAEIAYTLIKSDGSLVIDTVASGSQINIVEGQLSACAISKGYANSETVTVSLSRQPRIAYGWSFNFIDSLSLACDNVSLGEAVDIEGVAYRTLSLRNATDTIDVDRRFAPQDANWLQRNQNQNSRGFFSYGGARTFALLGLKEGQFVKLTCQNPPAFTENVDSILVKDESLCYGNTLVYRVLARGNGRITMERSNYLYSVEVGFEDGNNFVDVPSVAITAVNGVSRSVVFTQPDYDKVYYKTAEEQDYQLYVEPLTVNQTTNFDFYAATEGNLNSEVCHTVVDAGFEIALANVSMTVVGYDPDMEIYSVVLDADQQQTLCQPEVTIYYTIDYTKGQCAPGETIQTSWGMIKAHAEAEGYAASEETILPLTSMVETPRYTLSSDEYVNAADSTWSFSNGFAIGKTGNFVPGGDKTMKLENNVQYTIFVPDTVTVTGLCFIGFTDASQVDNSKAWIGELNGKVLAAQTDDKSSEAYKAIEEPFAGSNTNYMSEYRYNLEEPQSGGVITFTICGSSPAALRIGLYGEYHPISALPFQSLDESQTECYDILGRRVENPTQPGIYIVNGKKLVVK